MQPDLRYVPAPKWEKRDDLTVISSDGSIVSVNPRGLIRYERPDKFTLCCGFEREPCKKKKNQSEGTFDSPVKGETILLFKEDNLVLMQGGYVTDYELDKKKTIEFFRSIEASLKFLGFLVKVIDDGD